MKKYMPSIFFVSLFLMSLSISADILYEPVTPLPKFYSGNSNQISLGKMLFIDKRLSGEGGVSCASCHHLDNGGVDGLPKSVGSKGQLGTMNVLTVFNVGFQFRYFWDGRAETLEDQIDGPVLAEHEMASSWPHIINVLKNDEVYLTLFNELFNDGITINNVKQVIAEFERSLITPNSRFDQFLNGKEDAINVIEKQGYEKFKSYGCSSCHQGRLLGGNMYEKLGVVVPYYDSVRETNENDYGRFIQTGDLEDKFEFKVPSLRNVELTGPYFHDGSISKLGEAVRIMALHQTGRELSGIDIQSIVAFLKTLTGDIPSMEAVAK